MLREIEVVHPWTKERVRLPVETVSEFHIRVRWGMAGIYELDVRTNKLRSMNPAVRRKHPHCVWTASDIELVRRQHWEHLNPGKQAEFEESYRKHQEWIVSQGKDVKDGTTQGQDAQLGRSASPQRKARVRAR